MCERSRGKASQATYRKGMEIIQERKWVLVGSTASTYPGLLRDKDTAAVKQGKAESAPSGGKCIQDGH